MFSLALAARFMRHATTLRTAAASGRVQRKLEELAVRYERAADYIHKRFKRRNAHDRCD